MTNQELYINNIRVNLGTDFGVRLNRQLLNPAELNTKDAQFSFSVSLPTGGINDTAFNYSRVEETRDKFNRIYAAEYIVNGLRLFNGNFTLTSVTETAYKGNLYVPVPKTIKDIFGDVKLNANPELRISFTDFATSLSSYNVAAATAPQYAIFPYVLYGVLPKVPTNVSLGTYSARNLWDSSARIGIADLPPAINTLLMLKHIFTAQGYSLSGTAFNDEKLRQLYISYKNDSAYVQPWNYGKYGHIHVTGAWSNWQDRKTVSTAYALEQGVSIGELGDYAVDMLDSSNSRITILDDPGGNVLYSEIPGSGTTTWVRGQIRIPVAGFYKVTLIASIHVATDSDLPVKGGDISFISGLSDHKVADFTNTPIEFRVSRDNGQGDFGLNGARTDGQFYQNNQPQNTTFDDINVPKYFPQLDSNGQINFVDKAQDENVVLGFMFGQSADSDTSGFKNPKDTASQFAQVYAAKPALSYDNSANDKQPFRLAIKSPGYWKYDFNGTTVGYVTTTKYAIDLINAPLNYAKRGQYAGITGADPQNNAQGSASAVVWFEAGELITLAAVSSQGQWQDNLWPVVAGWVRQNLLFDLEITPFRTDAGWLMVNTAGDGTATMDWNDATNFDTTTIDLVKFLDADMKTDDFINNFVSAFNLRLYQTAANAYALDVKQNKKSVSSRYVNLDTIVSVKDRENTPLGLPATYKLGFTIDTDEEGYVESGSDDGGGLYNTGAVDGGIVEQTSAFSYNWFKNITKIEIAGSVVLPLPIISETDVWDSATSYPDAMKKRYTNLAYRFFYYNGLLNTLGATFAFNGASLSIARVSNQLGSISVLNYKNVPYTILDNYFTLLINGSSHYTEVAGYITAAMYAQLDGSILAMFNGDLYYIAELNAYDSTGKNQTNIKLIRKI